MKSTKPYYYEDDNKVVYINKDIIKIVLKGTRELLILVETIVNECSLIFY